MEGASKGTVTSLASVFPAEDVQKAAKRVEEKIEEKRDEMNRLRQFIADNTNLINLVQKLPDQLHHDIMVPFGKAAFFPGRLIHTNEFLVLLGEGYHVERTAKQTIDILKRRGKALESQVDSLKAMMQDLEAEASFFDASASETKEGLVEIRENYVEENSTETVSESGALKQDSSSFSEGDNRKAEIEDEEYARIMSRLDELEKEELAAGSDDEKDKDLAGESDYESDEDEQTNVGESQNEDDKDEDEQTKTNVDHFQDQNSLEHNVRYSEVVFSIIVCTGLTVQPVSQDEIPHGKSLAHMKMPNPAVKAPMLPKGKIQNEVLPSPRNEVAIEKSKPGFDSSKAFTGLIMEHTHNLQTNAQGQTASSQLSGSQPSKPVSRFKMQRR